MGHRTVNDFIAELEQRLDSLREQNLLRVLRRVDSPQSPRIQIDGNPFLNFSSNDYLGLADHPVLKEAALRAVEKYGVGSGASRLVCGSLAPFQELEESLAGFKKTESALTFSTGYAAAIGTICALLGKDDIIILDKLVHACIVDAARLSGAKIRVFAHNDLADLEDKLAWAKSQDGSHQTLVVTESIFSMDGDAAPLREIADLKDKFNAWLMVDEAHATGIIGESGRGLADELGIANRVEIQMGTLGKALGASGGYICGARALVDFLVNRARSFIFSTAPLPASAAAATAAIKLIQSTEGEQRRTVLREHVGHLTSPLAIPGSKTPGAIIPIILGGEEKAVAASLKLREQGIFVPAIRYPTVARGKARLRVTLSAAHSTAHVTMLVDALRTSV
ncbi:MAG TPA: 8-amino-7-oxononanoate synthase [Verrucomicrobiae bacterium]|jgi:8-amino-7-oxononanoate synthase